MRNPLMKMIGLIVLFGAGLAILWFFEAVARDSVRMSREFSASMYGVGVLLSLGWLAATVRLFSSIREDWVGPQRRERSESLTPSWLKGATLLSAISCASCVAFWFLIYDFLTTTATAEEASFIFLFGSTLSAISLAALLACFSVIMRDRR